MRAALTQGLPALGLELKILPDLEKFSNILLEKNRVMDLTAITEPRDVATLHLLDSLCLVPLLGPGPGSVVDVGTGAGFPGVPLAIALPDKQVTLLDSLGKRVKFLEEASKALGLLNVACVHERAEEFALSNRERFDWAVSRAVAVLPVLCELCLPLVKVGGTFLAMKSVSSDAEIAGAQTAIGKLGGRLEEIRDYIVPTTEVVHRVAVVRKISATPAKYPRRFAQIKKQPL